MTLGSTAETTVTLADNDPPVTGRPRILSVELTSDPRSRCDLRHRRRNRGQRAVQQNRDGDGHAATRADRWGLSRKQAAYRDSAGEVARFVYTVAAGDSDDNGVSIAANSLALNGGTIRGGGNVDAVRTHSAVAANRNHRVDAVRPVFQSAQVNLMELILTYNEPLDETSVPPASAFTVRVDGVRHGSVTDVAVRRECR